MAATDTARAEPVPAGEVTRRRLKVAAQALFAERGIDGVTVQQIVAAAGQRNNASLHYHFGNKEELVRQLVVDGARLVDARRQAMLDRIEAAGRAGEIRDVMYALMLPVIGLSEEPDQQTYLRFIANLQLTRRELLREAVGDRWNTGYRRCLDHLRRILADIPKPVLDQRLSLVGIYGNAILAAREEFLSRPSTGTNGFWDHPYTLENIIDTMVSSVAGPPSPQTTAQLESAHRR